MSMYTNVEDAKTADATHHGKEAAAVVIEQRENELRPRL